MFNDSVPQCLQLASAGPWESCATAGHQTPVTKRGMFYIEMLSVEISGC